MCKSIFPMDTEYEVLPPAVEKETKAFYKHVVTVGRHGAKFISQTNKKAYGQYVKQLHQ